MRVGSSRCAANGYGTGVLLQELEAFWGKKQLLGGQREREMEGWGGG